MCDDRGRSPRGTRRVVSDWPPMPRPETSASSWLGCLVPPVLPVPAPPLPLVDPLPTTFAFEIYNAMSLDVSVVAARFPPPVSTIVSPLPLVVRYQRSISRRCCGGRRLRDDDDDIYHRGRGRRAGIICVSIPADTTMRMRETVRWVRVGR